MKKLFLLTVTLLALGMMYFAPVTAEASPTPDSVTAEKACVSCHAEVSADDFFSPLIVVGVAVSFEHEGVTIKRASPMVVGEVFHALILFDSRNKSLITRTGYPIIS
jgi:hypothetical protein